MNAPVLPELMPELMTVTEIAAFGDPDQLISAQRPLPVPAAGEVLIRVEAAGVNRPDVLQRKGHYPPPPGVSDLPGLEVAGEVVHMGAGVEGIAAGDKVTALIAGGGYARYAVAPAGQCLPIPTGLSMVEAASLPETAFTIWTNLMEGGRFQKGDSVLIHGGTSGIGVMAIQMVRALGGRAFATAGSAEKARSCEALGAERGIDYRSEDFVEVIRQATDGRGVDIILDMVGGDYLPRNIDSLAMGGRIVMIAFLRGRRPQLDIAQVMAKRAIVTGSTLRGRTPEEKAAIARDLQAHIWPLIEAGKIRAVIDSEFPLRDAASAHVRMEQSAHIGKIVLIPE